MKVANTQEEARAADAERNILKHAGEEDEQKSDFRRRNLFGLRAVADGAAAALLFDFAVSLSDGAVTFTLDWLSGGPQHAPVHPVHLPGLELMFGALLGVWTVVASVNKRDRAKRAEEREKQLKVGREVKQIQSEWSNFFNSVDSMLDAAGLLNVGRIGARHEIASEDDVDTALLWLETMDQLEGDMAIRMLLKLSSSEKSSVRRRLALGLGLVSSPSNIVDATLVRLSHDDDAEVRAIASDSLEYIHGVCAPSDDDDEAEAALKRERSERLRLAKLRGEGALLDAMRGGADKARPPVDSFDALDIHTLFVVSALALGAEIAALAHGEQIPFRFLGMGWLFAVAGLSVYPFSTAAWDRVSSDIRKTMKRRQ